MGCQNSSSGINYLYGYCPLKKITEQDPKDDSTYKKLPFEKANLKLGLYEYDGSETLIVKEFEDKTFLIQARETWFTKKGSTTPYLNTEIVCTRNLQKFSSNGRLSVRDSQVTQLEVNNNSFKTSTTKTFNLVYDPSLSENKIQLFTETDPNKSIDSPKEYYRKRNAETSFFQVGEVGDKTYELRTESKIDEFTIYSVVKYKLK